MTIKTFTSRLPLYISEETIRYFASMGMVTTYEEEEIVEVYCVGIGVIFLSFYEASEILEA